MLCPLADFFKLKGFNTRSGCTCRRSNLYTCPNPNPNHGTCAEAVRRMIAQAAGRARRRRRSGRSPAPAPNTTYFGNVWATPSWFQTLLLAVVRSRHRAKACAWAAPPLNHVPCSRRRRRRLSSVCVCGCMCMCMCMQAVRVHFGRWCCACLFVFCERGKIGHRLLL